MSKRNKDGKKSKNQYEKINNTDINISFANSLPSNPILTIKKDIMRQIKKLKLVNIFNPNRKEYNLDPIDGRMRIYRKGFKSRSLETLNDFDNVITNGFGMHNNQTDYTLRFSLTPEVVRDPYY